MLSDIVQDSLAFQACDHSTVADKAAISQKLSSTRVWFEHSPSVSSLEPHQVSSHAWAQLVSVEAHPMDFAIGWDVVCQARKSEPSNPNHWRSSSMLHQRKSVLLADEPHAAHRVCRRLPCTLLFPQLRLQLPL